MPDERPEQAQVPPPLHSHVPNLEQFLQELYLFRAQYEASQTVQQLDLQSAIDTLSNAISVVSVAVGGGGISVAGTANQISITAAGTLRTLSIANPLVTPGDVNITSTDVVLTRDAANVLALKNLLNGQTLRIYKQNNAGVAVEFLAIQWSPGDATFRIGANVIGFGAVQDLIVGAGTGSQIYYVNSQNRLLAYTNGNLRWEVNASGHFIAGADDTLDLGIVGNRFRDVYVGRNLQVSGTISAPIIDTLSNAVSVLSQQVSVISQQVSVHSQQISVLSQQISVLSQALSVVSNAVSNALSVANAASNAASVVSVAAANATSIANAVSAKADTLSNQISVLSQQVSVLSQQISVLSQGLSVVSNAASNALSVANAASNAASVVSVAAANATSIANAVSAKADTLSNQISVLSQQVSVLSQQVSVLSQAVSVLSQSVSVLSNTVSAISVRMDTLSNAVSVVSQAVSVLSQSVSVLSQSVSVLSQQVSVISQQVSVLSVTRTVEGQCRVSVKSTTSVTLQPYKGQMLWINGAPQKIPSGGVDMPTTGLTSATTYNLYAYMSATVMTLTATVSAHATDTTAGNVGVEILAGDSTRSLVGKVRLNAAVNFVDSATQRFLINWFNRRGLALVNNFTANRSTTSTTYTEVNTEIRCEFLTWGDEAVCAGIAGTVIAVLPEIVTSIGFDGTTAENATSGSGQANQDFTLGVALYKSGLSEGYHYATLIGEVSSANTGTWYGGAVGDLRVTSLTLQIRG